MIFIGVLLLSLLLEVSEAQKGGAKAGMRRGGSRGGGRGRGGGGGNRGDDGGMGEFGGRAGYGEDRKKKPCVGLCYLR